MPTTQEEAEAIAVADLDAQGVGEADLLARAATEMNLGAEVWRPDGTYDAHHVWASIYDGGLLPPEPTEGADPLFGDD